MKDTVSKNKRSAKEWVYRSLFFLFGLLIMSFGIAFSIKAGLGTSPISSAPYVISLFSSLTVGNMTIIMHCIFITCQILILRKNYQLFQLLQLPVAFIFGYMTDFAVYCIKAISCENYLEQWLYCIVGIILVAVAVSMEVVADVVVLAGEGLILAVCKSKPAVTFGYMKVMFDVSLVVIAVVLSLIFIGKIEGVREGTVAAAVCVGLLAKQFNKVLYKINIPFCQ